MLCTLNAGCGHRRLAPTSDPHSLLQQPLKDFEKRTINGHSLDTATLRGKTIVVDFFADYCAPCKRTLPELEHLHRSTGEDIVVIGVSLDERQSQARAVSAELGLTFPIVHDRGMLRGRFRVDSLPATFVIDSEGVIQWARIGTAGASHDDLERAVRFIARS